ncbi:AbrB/MazE/SpoVT family DNA-binding domain-containing protein [Novosphingobium sp. Chol11]|uniref:AbrB/MazE/SpoVT family DNA-binding domain-containing protein n=1 Tax=Novosphingobium sp. Chol11 TaxID=1385763 RepID=UPI0025CE35B5|nr:AbrB/MazE/SpoVT family DNA-binding domain-containing protein [Novosphingobium sp. Chol11]
MSQVIVGKWGKSLAVRVPIDVAAAAGLVDGEAVEIEAVDGTIVIRRDAAKAQAQMKAQQARAEIIELSKVMTLGGLSIRELIDEGRR